MPLLWLPRSRVKENIQKATKKYASIKNVRLMLCFIFVAHFHQPNILETKINLKNNTMINLTSTTTLKQWFTKQCKWRIIKIIWNFLMDSPELLLSALKFIRTWQMFLLSTVINKIVLLWKEDKRNTFLWGMDVDWWIFSSIFDVGLHWITSLCIFCNWRLYLRKECLY